jgi:MtN3 and saliva related transmembrane protein
MEQIFGILGGALTTASFVPQVLRAWRTRSTADLSIAMLLLFIGGLLCWLAYGVLLREPPIIMANAATLVLALALLGLKIKHG